MSKSTQSLQDTIWEAMVQFTGVAISVCILIAFI